MRNIYINAIKPALDFLASLIAIIILSPLLLVLMIAIKIDSPGPIFFCQKRVGRGKKYFKILKFRTMHTNTPSDMPTHMLANADNYITRTGKFLRKTSLDELPQLFNILAGQMSAIGPRPALWNQYDLIELRDKSGANDIRPGLTGWAQINGRDELSLEAKAAYDAEYTAKIGLAMDIRCMLSTVFKVLRAEGVREGSQPAGSQEPTNTSTEKDSDKQKKNEPAAK